jgi:hypothetical protein
VVDLVEVHLVRLGQPERAQQERPDDEHHDEEQVEAVQPTPALGAKRRAAVGSDGRLAEAGAQPASSNVGREVQVGIGVTARVREGPAVAGAGLPAGNAGAVAVPTGSAPAGAADAAAIAVMPVIGAATPGPS